MIDPSWEYMCEPPIEPPEPKVRRSRIREGYEARIAELEAQLAEARRGFDLVAHLHRQRAFSLKTFGPGYRTAGVVDHIQKELLEIKVDPLDLYEWIDVALLAFDGAWRAGWQPEAIAEALAEKLTRNESRQWPDWRTADPDSAITHIDAAIEAAKKESGR